ncbi:hypothetical protein BJY04DRAFT_187108, partial [Aspergillus karnatakaensis]|uniref:uncharacterized protein n=1 Tax=Aspergillus karnatakaensis TaxID=1810916 RepID=UPI003CCD43E0
MYIGSSLDDRIQLALKLVVLLSLVSLRAKDVKKRRRTKASNQISPDIVEGHP